jgi:hypothetical protein
MHLARYQNDFVFSSQRRRNLWFDLMNTAISFTFYSGRLDGCSKIPRSSVWQTTVIINTKLQVAQ